MGKKFDCQAGLVSGPASAGGGLMASVGPRGSASGGSYGCIPGPRTSADVAGYGYIPGGYCPELPQPLAIISLQKAARRGRRTGWWPVIRAAISCSGSQLPS